LVEKNHQKHLQKCFNNVKIKSLFYVAKTPNIPFLAMKTPVRKHFHQKTVEIKKVFPSFLRIYLVRGDFHSSKKT